MKDKKEIIRKVIGQIHNGVLVPKEITIRKGKIFRYKAHNEYSIGLNEVKETILKNLHSVSEKLTDRNLEILEFVLGKIEGRKQRNCYDNKNEDEDYKELKFDEIKILDVDKDWRGNQELTIYEINGVRVNKEGNIKFIKMEKGKCIDDNINISNRLHNLLYFKFRTSIENMSERYIKSLNDRIDKRTKEIDEIKKKGSALLMVAEIQNGEDEVRGFGG